MHEVDTGVVEIHTRLESAVLLEVVQAAVKSKASPIEPFRRTWLQAQCDSVCSSC